MLFKIDENLHEEVAELLRQNGHDAVSVYDQHMRGHTDEDVAAVCRREGRVIVTQDLDFSTLSPSRRRITRALSSFAFTTRVGLPSSPRCTG